MAAALAGCSATPRDTRADYEAPEASETRAPLAELPPGAGEVVAVLQSKAHFLLTQRIVLRGDSGTSGENAIVVKVNQDPGPIDFDGPNGLPTQGMIGAELDSNFPGVQMELSQTFARNSLGPFGYAVGHPSAHVNCIYAWQFSAAKPMRLGETEASNLPTQPTSVRVRLCRSSLGEAEMVRLLQGLQVYAPGSRMAFGDSTAATGQGDALSASGVGYFVVPGVASRAAHAPRPHHKHKVAHHSRHRLAEAREERAAATDAPLRDWTPAPMPPGGASSRASQSANPLLAPLAAPAMRASSDDLPLPSRSAPAAIPAAAPRASIPLPN